MKYYNVLGLMSGTSCDGLDMALCRFTLKEGEWTYEILKTKVVEYSVQMRKKLQNSYLLSGIELIELDTEFSLFCAERIIEFKACCHGVIHIVASHGHTVFHQPEKKITLQIGNGEMISKMCNITVVSDFRTGDVALGGQGAPLVPVGDELLFGDFCSCLNLGGFSNISYRNSRGKRIAFDISPVNIVLNELAGKSGFLFDDKGMMAASGKIIQELFDNLENIEYYKSLPPKSLSREWVDKYISPLWSCYSSEKNENIMATFTMHTATRIAEVLKRMKNVLITGGGAYNDFLISEIKKNTNTEIIIPEKELIDFKEAVVFAFLGLLRYRNENNCLSSVTGAETDSCCGVISLP